MTTQQRLGPSGGRPPWLRRFLSLRSVQLIAAFWVLATIAVFLIVGDGELPFGERPSLEGVLLSGEVINGWANVGVALILIGVTYLVTKGRAVPGMAARAPGRPAALAETAGLVGYGVLVQFGASYSAAPWASTLSAYTCMARSTAPTNRSLQSRLSSGCSTTSSSTRSCPTCTSASGATRTSSSTSGRRTGPTTPCSSS